MAITKERKRELVAEYSELLSKTDGFIITEYRGLTVSKLDDLRNRLREASGGGYSITKNTLFSIALEQQGWPVPADLFLGPTAVAFGNGNLPAVAKAIQAFQKDNPDIFVVKGGVLEQTVFAGKDVEVISNLPTMEEARAQLVGLITQPATALAGLLNSATGQVVNVLSAYVREHSTEGEGAAA